MGFCWDLSFGIWDLASAHPWLRTRLSVHMLLTYAMWGAWAPVLGKYLFNIGFAPERIALVYGTGALATMVSPLIAGQIADRWFATEKFLAVSYAVSGALFLYATQLRDFTPFWWTAFIAMCFYMPTLALGNSMSFHHLADPRRDFPPVRVWGTIGWIAGGWGLWAWLTQAQAHGWPGQSLRTCLALAGGIALLNALYSLTLPHTPPNRDARAKFAAGEAFAMMRHPPFAVLTVGAFLLMLFATFYFTGASIFFPTIGVTDENLSLVQSVGQWAEILTVLVLPPVYLKLGPRRTLLLGLAAWTARFGLMAAADSVAWILAAQVLHGACFAFVLAAASIWVEEVCPADARASVQNLLSFFYYGLGMFAGSFLASRVTAHFTVGSGVLLWSRIWLVPAAGCGAVLILFLLGFHPRRKETESRRDGETENR